ncbi:hypothetical protein RND81_12G101900 [Saponaria officinalis]|uniref:Uncharacterized protein n=1 Tax=Saponaria officinalis TaxID=3572 RepID=A0AAW1H8S5_SAPOF
MPRSSRHKSSKHSSRDAREYSDSEKESGFREKKGKEDGGSSSSSRHLKDLSSSEKRKLDSKPVDVSKKSIGSGNAEYEAEFGGGGLVLSSSRKRKDKVDDDRWNGGDDDVNQLEMSKSEMKEKEEVRGSGDSKRSSRRSGNYVSGFDVQEAKKSGSKAEGKHHRSERKERGEKDGVSERDRKGGRSDRSEKLVDVLVDENKGSERSKKLSGSGQEHGGKHSAGKTGKIASDNLVDIVSVSEHMGSEGNRKLSGAGEERSGKHSVGNADLIIHEEIKNTEPDRDLDRRVRRKRDGSGDVDRHHAVRDLDDRKLSSREDIAKSGKYKDDSHKDDRNRDRFQEDMDKDMWRQDEKQRDNRSTRNYTSGKFDDKHLRIDKTDLDSSHKKSLRHGGEYDRESDRDRERDGEYGRDRGRDRDRSRLDTDRDREHGDRERDHDRDRDRERDLERVHDRDREFDRDREQGSDRYRRELRGRIGVRDHERGRERNFDADRDNDYALHVDERGSRYKDDRGRRRSPDRYDDYHNDKLRRVKTEGEKERSVPHKPNADSVTSSSRRRASPSSRSYAGADKYRDGIQDETKFGDSLRDSTMPEADESAPKYRSGEKRAKCDDNHIEEFSERSPNTKVSPAGLKERSPSMSYDRSRFSSRNTRRRSLDVEDTEKRSSGSNDVRDMGVTEDRQSLPPKKFSGDDYPRAESPFYHNNKSGQGNVSSHGPGPSVFRTRADSPSFAGSFGEDNRGPGSRYRRSVDPNIGRGPGNAWSGVPNWPSPLPNGFMPFPPGPPGPHHGGFPPMLSQFPPHFGVRPTLDISHQGMPYHLADGDRFSGHVRPMGWPNMVDGPMPPPFHVWDAGSGMLRDDSSMYGPGNLGQRRDMNLDVWKQNGDMNMDVISGSQKDGPTIKASADEASSAQCPLKPNVESSCLDDQATSFKKGASSGQSPMKEALSTPAKGTTDKTPESSGIDDTAKLLRAYLAKLDISMDLADPEVCNQCINLAIKWGCEDVEDDVELDFMEEKAVVKSEITNLTVDMKIFPAAKESIFQRAMNVYKTQSSISSLVPKLDKIRSPSPSEPEAEKTVVLKANNDSPSKSSVKQEEQAFVLPEETVPPHPTTGEGEDVKPVSMTGGEVMNGGPLQNSDLALADDDELQLPVFEEEKIEVETVLELIPENADKVDLSPESAGLDPVIPNTDEEIVVDGGKNFSSVSGPGEHSDVPVSGPLNVCIDSVKVCEALISVSNESESAVLSRIHDAPESTH